MTATHPFGSSLHSVQAHRSLTTDAMFMALVMSIVAKRAGGTFTITQADLDSVAFGQLHEESRVQGGTEVRFIFKERKQQ